MALRGDTPDKIATYMQSRADFRHGNVSAKHHNSDNPPNYGYLHATDKVLLRDAFDGSDIYVVYSYNTPIAWISDKSDGWVVPTASYSVTTTNHQSTILRAIRVNGEQLNV